MINEQSKNPFDGTEWIRCPICSGKTRMKIRPDTVILYFPLYCPKCGKESLISVRDKRIEVIQEPDAKTQSR